MATIDHSAGKARLVGRKASRRRARTCTTAWTVFYRSVADEIGVGCWGVDVWTQEEDWEGLLGARRQINGHHTYRIITKFRRLRNIASLFS